MCAEGCSPINSISSQENGLAGDGKDSPAEIMKNCCRVDWSSPPGVVAI